MNDCIKSIRNKDGGFVYFGETDEPIVVKKLKTCKLIDNLNKSEIIKNV